MDRAAAHIRNCELVVGSCHRRNHGGGSGENHGHGYSRRHFLLNFAARLGGPYHSRRQVADILRRRGRPDLSRSSGQAPYAAAGGAKRCKRFGEASVDRSFAMNDFRIPAASSDRKARAVLIETRLARCSFRPAAFQRMSSRFAADSPSEEEGFELFVPLGISASSSWWSRPRKPHGAPEGGFSLAGPIVRIHLPPLRSLSQQWIEDPGGQRRGFCGGLSMDWDVRRDR